MKSACVSFEHVLMSVSTKKKLRGA